MNYFLLQNPPRQTQFYPTRNSKFSGGVLIHTTESVMDNVGPDTGAENVAGFISRRTDYGCYHVIVDSDSTVHMIPDTYTTFHCAANGYNSTTWGISMACRTTDLNINDPWTQKTLDRVGYEIAAMWTRNGIDINKAAKFIPAEQTKTQAGLTTHGDAQPWDRSDAFTKHPQRKQIEEIIIKAIHKHKLPTPETGETTMKQIMMRNEKTGTISVFYQGTPFRLDLRPQDVQKFLYFGIEDKGNTDPWFWEISQPITPVYK